MANRQGNIPNPINKRPIPRIYELPKQLLQGATIPDDSVVSKAGDSYTQVDSTGATIAQFVKDSTDTWVKVADNQRAATYVHGLTGVVAVGTTSQYTFSFIDGLFRDANGNQRTILGATNILVDATVAGPTAGGRDQASAFAVGPRDLYLYAIWGDGLGVSGIVSELGTPSTGGPVLPTGYTHWCFLTVFTWGTAFPISQTKGSWVYLNTSILFLVGDTNTAETILSAPGAYPAAATSMQFLAEGTLTTNAGGVAKENFVVRHVTGLDYMTLVVRPPSASTQAVNSTAFIIPSTTAQTTWHQWVNVNNPGNVSTRSANMWCMGYQVPNGS